LKSLGCRYFTAPAGSALPGDAYIDASEPPLSDGADPTSFVRNFLPPGLMPKASCISLRKASQASFLRLVAHAHREPPRMEGGRGHRTPLSKQKKKAVPEGGREAET